MLRVRLPELPELGCRIYSQELLVTEVTADPQRLLYAVEWGEEFLFTVEEHPMAHSMYRDTGQQCVFGLIIQPISDAQERRIRDF